jgi:choline dehydrogenase-like flavoprotein
LPALTAAQWATVPAALQRASRAVALLDAGDVTKIPPTLEYPGATTLEQYSAFLNQPYLSTPGKLGLKTTAQGWYRDKTSMRWPGFAVYDKSGNLLPYTLTRTPSPDLQKAFGDERYDLNRFTVTYSCPDMCTLAALKFGRPPLSLPIEGDHDLSAASDSRTLYVDRVTYDWAANAELGLGQSLALSARAALAAAYQLLVPLLLLAGLVALIAAGDGAMAARALNPVLLVAATAWLIAATQIVRMALIDASSFPTMTAQQVAPVAYLAGLATMLSFGAVIVQARRSTQQICGDLG